MKKVIFIIFWIYAIYLMIVNANLEKENKKLREDTFECLVYANKCTNMYQDMVVEQGKKIQSMKD